jgi:hypothetical protein
MVQEARALADLWMLAQFLLLQPAEALEADRQSSSQRSRAPRLVGPEAVARARLRCRRQAVTSLAWVEAAAAQESVAETIREAA